MELVRIVPEDALGTEAVAEVLIHRAILETGAVRRGPDIMVTSARALKAKMSIRGL